MTELDYWSGKPETKVTVDNLIRDTLRADLPESYEKPALPYTVKIFTRIPV